VSHSFSPVSVVSVAVIEGITRFPSLCKYTVMLCIGLYLLELHSSNFMPNCLSVFGIYCVQIALPSKSTVISTASVQLGC